MENPEDKEELEEIENFYVNLIFNEGKVQERKRILLDIDKLEQRSHATKTPIYQDTMFKLIREIILQGD
jgi:hypothetical protein